MPSNKHTNKPDPAELLILRASRRFNNAMRAYIATGANEPGPGFLREELEMYYMLGGAEVDFSDYLKTHPD